MKNETSAGGIVFKKEADSVLWLIAKHSFLKAWVFPKGLIGDKNPGEPMELAALREVEEEGGIKAQIILPTPITTQYTYNWHGSPHGGNSNENILVEKTVYYFLMKYLSGDPKKHDWEMEDALFATEEVVKEKLTYPSDKKAFVEILYLFNSLK